MSAEEVRPISPDEVGAEKERIFPSAVMESFNELIAAHYANGSARIPQQKVVDLMIKKGLTKEDINNNGWLNVEELFRAKGWKVTYDKPGYNEQGQAYFLFQRSRRRRDGCQH